VKMCDFVDVSVYEGVCVFTQAHKEDLSGQT
jgi:hypothetical protein